MIPEIIDLAATAVTSNAGTKHDKSGFQTAFMIFMLICAVVSLPIFLFSRCQEQPVAVKVEPAKPKPPLAERIGRGTRKAAWDFTRGIFTNPKEPQKP